MFNSLLPMKLKEFIEKRIKSPEESCYCFDRWEMSECNWCQYASSLRVTLEDFKDNRQP